MFFVSIANAQGASNDQYDFEIEDIRVQGLQRFPVSRVFAALPVGQNDQLSAALAARLTRDVYALGVFSDVQIFRDVNDLVVQVQERPTISDISIDGNEMIETDVLMDALKQGGLTAGSVMQRATLERMKTELERQYVAQGRYGAAVIASTNPQSRNRVEISLDIREGEVAKIRDIHILGNNEYDTDTLLDELALKKSHFWSFIKGDDKYAREKLAGDLEALRSYYFDRGFIRFEIDSTQVSITDDKEEIFITVHVSEGKQHKIGQVDVKGILPIPKKKIEELILVKPGQKFSRALLTLSQEAISKRLGVDGYTFAQVEANPTIQDNEIVDVTFYVNPGKRVSITRISFYGSTTTQEEVYRRELRQMEGAWAESQKIELSKLRLERLPYIKNVEVETVKVPGTDDQIELVFNLEEQPSGSIGANIGYGGSGFQFGLNYNESNFLGTGDSLDLLASRNIDRTSLRLTHRDPHYTVHGVSRGYSLIYQSTDYERSREVTNYRTDEIGAKANFGYPISEQARLNFGLGYDQTEVFAFDSSADEVKNFVDADDEFAGVQSKKFDTFSVEASWFLNQLNRGLLPDEGSSQSLQLEVGVPGSDNTYYLTRYNWQQYFPINDSFTVRGRFELGYGDGYGDTESLPFYKNFFAGGIQSVRGYDNRSLGPRDSKGIDSFGGNFLVESSVELLLPMPFVKDKRAWRSVFFIDAGNVFNVDRQSPNDVPNGQNASELSFLDVDLKELRLSAGFAFTWITPIGPFSLSYGKPFNTSEGDDLEAFQISIGQVF